MVTVVPVSMNNMCPSSHRIFSHILYQCVALITATTGVAILFADTQLMPQTDACKPEAAYIFYTLDAQHNKMYILIWYGRLKHAAY